MAQEQSILSSVPLTPMVFLFFEDELYNPFFPLLAASIPAQAPQTALEEPTLLANSSRELKQTAVTAWNQRGAV